MTSTPERTTVQIVVFAVPTSNEKAMVPVCCSALAL